MPVEQHCSKMPVRTLRVEDKVKLFPPDGIKTAKHMSSDEFLFQACEHCTSMASLNRALEKGANVNARNKDGCTPLIVASQAWQGSRYLQFIQKLLELGAEPDVESKFGHTAMDKVEEQIKLWEAKRKQEIKDQSDRREYMEGRCPQGGEWGTAEEQRKKVIWNQPLADELDTFKKLPTLKEGKQLLEKSGAKVGEDAFDPAYLTTEDFVERRDRILAKYSDPKYAYKGM